MKQQPKKELPYEVSAIIWSNIRRYQYLNKLTKQQLADILHRCPKSLDSYDKNPTTLTLEMIQFFIDSTGLTMEELISV